MLSPRSIPRPRPLSQLVRHALVGSGALFIATAVYAQATPENAQAVDYTVRIDAPRALEELLEDNLDLMRWRGNARVDLEQLQRLVKEAPEQARTLIATEGYYSPKVSAGLDTSGARPVARVIVDPGQPVLVGDLDLVLQGFVPFEEGGAPFDANALRNTGPCRSAASSARPTGKAPRAACCATWPRPASRARAWSRPAPRSIRIRAAPCCAW